MGEEKKNAATGPAFFRKRDLLVVAGLLLAALVLWLIFRNAQSGATAQVSIGWDAEQRTMDVPLGRDDTVYIDAALPVTLEIKDGAIRFVNSVCADHLCEHYGWLSHEGDWAACLPATVVVRIQDGAAE